MNKNVDNIKDILQYTMDLNRLRWTYEELLIDATCYKHMYNDIKKRIDKAIEYIENSDKYDFSKCELLDILKGSDSND